MKGCEHGTPGGFQSRASPPKLRTRLSRALTQKTRCRTKVQSMPTEWLVQVAEYFFALIWGGVWSRNGFINPQWTQNLGAPSSNSFLYSCFYCQYFQNPVASRQGPTSSELREVADAIARICKVTVIFTHLKKGSIILNHTHFETQVRYLVSCLIFGFECQSQEL